MSNIKWQDCVFQSLMAEKKAVPPHPAVTTEDTNGSSSAIAAGSPAASKKGKKDKMPNDKMNCKCTKII